jgi:hypothetical protein
MFNTPIFNVHVQYYPINPVGIWIKSIGTQVEVNKQKNEQAASEPQSEAGNMEKSKSLLFPKVAKSNPNIVFEHNCLDQDDQDTQDDCIPSNFFVPYILIRTLLSKLFAVKRRYFAGKCAMRKLFIPQTIHWIGMGCFQRLPQYGKQGNA